MRLFKISTNDINASSLILKIFTVVCLLYFLGGSIGETSAYLIDVEKLSTTVSIVESEDERVDKSSLEFVDQGFIKDDDEEGKFELFATIINSGDEDMTGPVDYKIVKVSNESGKPAWEVIYEGNLPPLQSGVDYKLRHNLTLTDEINHKFKFIAYQRPGHPGKGELKSEEIIIDMGDDDLRNSTQSNHSNSKSKKSDDSSEDQAKGTDTSGKEPKAATEDQGKAKEGQTKGTDIPGKEPKAATEGQEKSKEGQTKGTDIPGKEPNAATEGQGKAKEDQAKGTDTSGKEPNAATEDQGKPKEGQTKGTDIPGKEPNAATEGQEKSKEGQTKGTDIPGKEPKSDSTDKG
ncbi:hypothetical protein GLW05_13100 [Pontibacillus yanchengensis]|uniref:Amyloid fiber anchoring/assembly protein TapA n=1 Tax=Pontibacillus yanchengensis TaxID=462910 RepID=A0A6I4ZWP7_9BACI|nr:hypothetical protein [Pontibacillus yanchengensis]MYL34528.1 hypothetical protein [Pontibacillus yanchengensis]